MAIKLWRQAYEEYAKCKAHSAHKKAAFCLNMSTNLKKLKSGELYENISKSDALPEHSEPSSAIDKNAIDHTRYDVFWREQQRSAIEDTAFKRPRPENAKPYNEEQPQPPSKKARTDQTSNPCPTSEVFPQPQPIDECKKYEPKADSKQQNLSDDSKKSGSKSRLQSMIDKYPFMKRWADKQTQANTTQEDQTQMQFTSKIGT